MDVIGDFDGWSFPSGHVTHYVVFLGTLGAMVAWNMRVSVAKWLLYTTLFVALLAIGFSRIYLGAHWVGDVVGGYVFGAALIAVALGLWRMWVEREAEGHTRKEYRGDGQG